MSNQTMEGHQRRQEFFEFHENNPYVFTTLTQLCKDYKRRTGAERWSINAAIEVLRWQIEMDTDDPRSSFKINNAYAPFYARMIMDQEPELEDFFHTRTSIAD